MATDGDALRWTFAGLAVLYGGLGLYAAGFVGALLYTSRVRVWTRQRIVHILVVLLCAARCAFFGVVPTWDGVYFYVRMASSDSAQTALYVLEETPTLLLVTLYSQQLLAWAESAATAAGAPEGFPAVRARVYAGNAALYVAQAAVWAAYDRTAGVLDSDVWSLIAAVLHLAAVLALAALTLLYGRRLRASMAAVPAGLAMRLKAVRNVDALVGALTAALVVRSAALVGASLATFYVPAFETARGADTALTALFFVLTEAAPLAAVMWFNATLPGRRGRRAAAASASAGAKGGLGGAGGLGGGGGAGAKSARSFSPRVLAAAMRSMRFSLSPAAAAAPAAAGGSSAAARGSAFLLRAFSLGGARGAGDATERTPLAAGGAGGAGRGARAAAYGAGGGDADARYAPLSPGGGSDARYEALSPSVALELTPKSAAAADAAAEDDDEEAGAGAQPRGGGSARRGAGAGAGAAGADADDVRAALLGDGASI